jgi:hypothetical protein
MRKLLCLVLLSASLSLPLRAQSLNLNGTFWKQLSKDEKAIFVAAYEAGVFEGVSDTVHDAGVPFPKQAPLFHAHVFSQATYGAIVDGIDVCFADYRNQNLKIRACRQWAYYGIQGQSDLMRESYLEAERQISSPSP